jgi:invasion protein IalB
LPRGVTLQIDTAAPTAPVAFATCIYTGCIAELSFTRTQVATLRKGTNLKISAFANDGTPINMTVPLKGFADAEDRAASLITGVTAAAPKPAAAAPAALQ